MMKIKMKNQAAMEYAMYMISSSYFEKVICPKSKMYEKTLFLYYKEEKNQTQYLMEDLCIKYMDEFVKKTLPDKIWKQCVEVHLVKDDKVKITNIIFVGKYFTLKLIPQIRGGQKVNITCIYKEKGKDAEKWNTDVFSPYCV